MCSISTVAMILLLSCLTCSQFGDSRAGTRIDYDYDYDYEHEQVVVAGLAVLDLPPSVTYTFFVVY